MRTVLAVTDEQLDLASTVETIHRSNGQRIRHALNRAIEANGLSRSDLAHEAGIDGAEITRILDPQSDRHVPPRLMAAVMAKDRTHTFVGALADMVGMDLRPRAVDHAAENKALKSKLAALRSEIDALLEASP